MQQFLSRGTEKDIKDRQSKWMENPPNQILARTNKADHRLEKIRVESNRPAKIIISPTN